MYNEEHEQNQKAFTHMSIKKAFAFYPTYRKQEKQISDEEAISYVVCIRFVKLVVRCMGGDKMLNFLYKVSLITRVKTSNVIVGRKYARNERRP